MKPRKTSDTKQRKSSKTKVQNKVKNKSGTQQPYIIGDLNSQLSQ